MKTRPLACTQKCQLPCGRVFQAIFVPQDASGGHLAFLPVCHALYKSTQKRAICAVHFCVMQIYNSGAQPRVQRGHGWRKSLCRIAAICARLA